jgi:hypothetical protein
MCCPQCPVCQLSFVESDSIVCDQCIAEELNKCDKCHATSNSLYRAAKSELTWKSQVQECYGTTVIDGICKGCSKHELLGSHDICRRCAEMMTPEDYLLCHSCLNNTCKVCSTSTEVKNARGECPECVAKKHWIPRNTSRVNKIECRDCHNKLPTNLDGRCKQCYIINYVKTNHYYCEQCGKISNNPLCFECKNNE